MKNLEIKSEFDNHNLALNAVKKLRAKYHGILNQKDTYFNVSSGRLKVRVINGKTYELIHYYRANTDNARFCDYYIINLKNGKQVYEVLKNALDIKCEIIKKRRLYIYENVRIHLDNVKDLGKFLEFEVVCKSANDKKNARSKMKLLLKAFGAKNLVPYSYSDMILRKRS